MFIRKSFMRPYTPHRCGSTCFFPYCHSSSWCKLHRVSKREAALSGLSRGHEAPGRLWQHQDIFSLLLCFPSSLLTLINIFLVLFFFGFGFFFSELIPSLFKKSPGNPLLPHHCVVVICSFSFTILHFSQTLSQDRKFWVLNTNALHRLAFSLYHLLLSWPFYQEVMMYWHPHSMNCCFVVGTWPSSGLLFSNSYFWFIDFEILFISVLILHFVLF